MKTEKGITLVSVIIYVIAMVIVIATITTMTGYFYKNINLNTEKEDINLQYVKFNSFFSEQINKANNKVIACKTQGDESAKTKVTYIIFSDKNQYTFIQQNKAIYFNNVKIASYIEDCTFNTRVSNGKNIVEVTLKAKNFERTINYTLKN